MPQSWQLKWLLSKELSENPSQSRAELPKDSFITLFVIDLAVEDGFLAAVKLYQSMANLHIMGGAYHTTCAGSQIALSFI